MLYRDIVTDYKPVTTTTTVMKPIIERVPITSGIPAGQKVVLPGQLGRPYLSQQQEKQGLSYVDLLVMDKLTGSSSSSSSSSSKKKKKKKKSSSSTRSGGDSDSDSSDSSDDDTFSSTKSIMVGACYCDTACAVTGDCCNDFNAICLSDNAADSSDSGDTRSSSSSKKKKKKKKKKSSSSSSSGHSKLHMNALMQDPLGVGKVDPFVSMAFGVDPLTAMLMAKQGEGTCRNKCGMPGVLPPGARPSMPVPATLSVRRPISMPTQYFGAQGVGFRAGELDDVVEEETVAINRGFSNAEGVPVDADQDEIAAAKKAKDAAIGQGGVENRALNLETMMLLNAGMNQPPQPECGCDPRCTLYDNCCHDYLEMCVIMN